LDSRRLELRVESSFESQRGKAVGFLGLPSVVTLRVVGGTGPSKLRSRLSALQLDLFPLLGELHFGDSSLRLREVDISFRPEPVEERPRNLYPEVPVREPPAVLADADSVSG
jgi:hypothetical protein